jgi:hypothetical protein
VVLLAARPAPPRLDPAQVRNNVLTRFTHRLMAERYLELYRAEIGAG